MGVQDISGNNLNLNHNSVKISLLYVIPCVCAGSLVLNYSRSYSRCSRDRDRDRERDRDRDRTGTGDSNRDRTFLLESAMKAVNQPMLHPQSQPLPLQPEVGDPIVESPPAPLLPTTPENQTTITLQELSKYDGKGGNRAYVAVNGIVYDVTNNAAWAAATHFGLTAGKDLTNKFAACHAGQPVLSKLKVVGKLV